jgi:thioesterase domain-containing protein/acyl carrier protein
MVPSRFADFDTLPLTRSGKIDRGAIRTAAQTPPATTQPSYSRSLILTDTQARLAMIWAEALDVGMVELDDNFFEAGGDSLSAVTMLLDVEKLFDVRLSAQDLWNAPTLAAMARLIDRSRAQPDDIANRSAVYPMVKTGSGRPVFFNGAHTRLTQAGVWRLDCPLCGMAQWAHGLGFIKADTIEELAARQLADIRRVQPEGPYRLAGFSLGGLIAFEIAQQLRASGDHVEMLFLLDPMMPVRYALGTVAAVEEAPGYVKRPVAVRVRDHLKAIMRDPRRQIPHVWSRVLGQSSIWQRACYRLVDLHGRHPSRMTRALLPRDRWPAFWHAAGRLAQSYVARPYDGPAIAVFHRREERFRLWFDLLNGPARMEVIETSHLGMFVEPALTVWLDLLGASLDGSLQAPRGTEPAFEVARRPHVISS